MPRPKNDRVEYFPHFTESGKTVFILRNEFGNDGYAFWFTLLEILGSAEGHYYDTTGQGSWRYLLAKTQVDSDKAKSILDTLAELGKIDAELWRAGTIWCQRLVDNLKELYHRRGRACPEKPALPICAAETVSDPETTPEPVFPTQKPLSGGVSDPEIHQSKVKDSRVKDSKKEPATDVAGLPISPPSEEKPFDPKAIELADQFAALMKLHMPEILARMKNGYLKAWQESVDKLIRIDRRDPEEIARLISHCFDKDKSWWASTRNIRSPVKFRERNKEGVFYYDVILEEMNHASHQKNPGRNGRGKGNPAPYGDGEPYPVDYIANGDTGELIHIPRPGATVRAG